MVLRQNRVLGTLLAFGLVSYGLGACTSADDGGGSGSGGATESGGAMSTGGSGTGGTSASGGSMSSGGTKGSGGVQGTGGSVSTGGTGSGGVMETGGTAAGGAATGGSSTSEGSGGSGKGGSTTMGAGGGLGMGGAMGMGGKTGMGGAAAGGSGSGGMMGGGAGGSSSGSCQKGQTKGSEVVIMGESFYAISPQYIQKRVEDNAKKAGSLGSSDSYRNVAVSGQPMSYIASTEWDNAQKSPAKWVIMDGGGIDCMSSSCSSCPDTFKTLLGKMGTFGIKEVIYTRYPEPGNPPGSNATLKGNLDILMPKMQTVCEASTSPKCHWVDLRPVWVNGDTSDGLHPTQSGGNHVGDAIWAEMVKDCFAQ